jgi:hypothetical protein
MSRKLLQQPGAFVLFWLLLIDFIDTMPYIEYDNCDECAPWVFDFFGDLTTKFLDVLNLTEKFLDVLSFFAGLGFNFLWIWFLTKKFWVLWIWFLGIWQRNFGCFEFSITVNSRYKTPPNLRHRVFSTNYKKVFQICPQYKTCLGRSWRSVSYRESTVTKKSESLKSFFWQKIGCFEFVFFAIKNNLAKSLHS